MGTFASVIQKKASNNVVLYRAVSRDGRDFYAYIRCDEKQYHKMKHDFMTQNVCTDVKDYGEVLYTAYGKEPDAQAEKFLADYLRDMHS